jgi:GDPmannose 4,6-dehydratase
MIPRNPYGIAKLYAHQTAGYFRDHHGLFVCNAILYNHESPRRGHQYVSRLITKGVAEIARGEAKELKIGDLEALRDWGYAPDYVHAMWLMLQADSASDYVLATGVARSVRYFCETAFSLVGLSYEKYVVQNPQFSARRDLAPLVGNCEKAREVLDWKHSISFEDLVSKMVEADLANY